MRLAFVGSSPSIALYVASLRNKFNCTIFEKDILGGAWAESEIGGLLSSRACNGIGQKNISKSSFADFIEYFSKNGAVIKTISGQLPGDLVNPKSSHVVGRFMPAIYQIYNHANVSVLKHKIHAIEIDRNKVIIDGSQFDAVILPEHFSLDNIYILKKHYDISINTITSKHVRYKLNTSILDKHYTTELDSVFDRAGVQYPDNKVFVGRIRKELKSLSLPEIMTRSEWTINYRDNIVQSEILTYDSHWVAKEDISALRTALQGTTSNLVATQEILKAYESANNLSSWFNSQLY